MRSFSVCLAQVRPRWARDVLSHPYLSPAQVNAAAQSITGTDHCQTGREMEITYRTSTLVAALAEYYLRADLQRTDLAQLNKALGTVPALNASEDFGLCVASHNPAAARALALSEPGSPAEAEAARVLTSGIATCTRPDENLTVDLQSMRALNAVALYRAVYQASAR